MTKDDDPTVWCSLIAATCNHHIRRNGFTPYQYVLGKSPDVPTSLIENMEGDNRQLSAQSAALFEDGPRRAEQIRAASNRSFFELDSDDAGAGEADAPRERVADGGLARAVVVASRAASGRTLHAMVRKLPQPGHC